MRVFAFARRGARVGACVLALGAVSAAAQQGPSGTSSENAPPSATGQAAPAPQPDAQATDAVKSAEPATSDLPELVVNDDGKKKKKVVKTKPQPVDTSSTTDAKAEATAPPPGVTLGTTAPSDTGATTFDASNVKLRTDGGGDANTFMRNLPNVQYQNQNNSADPGAGSQKAIDTKPALLSISGAKTYENNFILNGVSISNITGPVEQRNILNDTTAGWTTGNIYGQSPQNIYVPTEFVGRATVIDSNASAEYGQFLGGVVLYDLAAPPTDRYHASVSASRDTSDFANYVLATPNGTNSNNRLPPSYEKTTLSASVGAPITRDFAFIAQVSRKEAESSKQMHPWVGDGFLPETSDNVFMRFAATARTDVGKFTLDTSRTDYSQSWSNYYGRDIGFDTNTHGSSTKLEYERDLPSVRADGVGLGRVKLTGRAFYNTNETENKSDSAYLMTFTRQVLVPASPGSAEVYHTTEQDDLCRGVEDPATYAVSRRAVVGCGTGGIGDSLQGQTDFGVQANLAGDVLLGSFKLGTELKQYQGRRARAEDYRSGSTTLVIGTDANGNRAVYDESYGVTTYVVPASGGFVCNGDPLCSAEEFANTVSIYPKYDTSVTLNALHTYAEIDQTWQWFNVRAGGRLDYDDYFKNYNIAPRLAGTVTPFEGLSFTAGYNRYYLGEALYYALRDGQTVSATQTRTYDPVTGEIINSTSSATGVPYQYRTAGLATPYQDEYTGVVRIADPLFGGQWRGKYLERYGRDQFATASCGTRCYTASNSGETFYRSASAEYTKEWSRLHNAFYLNAAAVTGNVTWSEQQTSHSTYLINADYNGDGTAEAGIWYNKRAYRVEEFDAITGNLDIPVRFGATLATVWFDGFLELNASAGINLGFQGVSVGTGTTPCGTFSGSCTNYVDRAFTPTLKLDVSGQINVTEQAAIQFSASNITNSAQNAVTTDDAPWVLGRSYYLGSSLRF
jgi:hypothetical protein